MAYKRTYKKRSMRKRSYKKRYNRRRYYKKGGLQKGRVTGIKTGFPETLMTKLSYAENNYKFTLAANSTITSVQLAANNPRDPFIAIGGKSALYFSTYAGLYKYCRVLGARVTIKFTKESDTNSGVNVAIIPRIGASAASLNDYDDVMSQPRVKYSNRTLNRIGDSVLIKYYLPIHTILQMNKIQYISQLPGDEYDAKINSDPTNIAIFEAYTMRTNDDSLSEIAVRANVHIKYYCKFYQRYRQIALGTDAGDDELDENEVGKPTELPPGAFEDQ